MGLQSQLNDVSSDSIPLLLAVLVANCVNQLRSVILSIFKSIRLHGGDEHHGGGVAAGGFLSPTIGSGLANLILLAEQLNINRLFSYSYKTENRRGSADEVDCVVCLCTLRDGDQVRKLDCRHVFHKECFDGWLDHLNFHCPLCRSPLVNEERVEMSTQRVGGDLHAWLSLR